MRPLPEQNRRHLQLIIELLRFNNLYQSLPLLAVITPFVAALLPNSLERMIQIGFGSFGIMVVEVFCILTLPVFLFRRYTCVPLLVLSIAVLLLGLFSSFYANIPEASFGLSVLISWVFLAASKIAWTRNDVYYLGICSVAILAALLLQIVYYGLGFGSYSSAMANTVGVVGETSRVRTTYGAATGTSVIIYVLTAFTIFTAYFYTRRIKWSLIFLAVGVAAMLLLFTRGGLLMIFAFALLLFFFRSRQMRVRFGAGIVLLMVGAGMLYGLFFSNQNFVRLLTDRGMGSSNSQLLYDSGRVMRYKEAIAYAKVRPLGGGLHNYYFRGAWLRNRPGIAEGRTSPHNTYLLFFAELGIPGLLLIVTFNLTVLVVSFRRRNYYFLIAIVPIVFIGHNLEVVYYEAPYIYLWGMLASLAMTLRNDELPGRRPPLPPGMIPPPPPGHPAMMRGRPPFAQQLPQHPPRRF